MSAHQIFADALLGEEAVCPPGLMTWNQSDPARRFAVYRNNVIVALIDALADSYPVTQELVGEEFFRGMARLFARDHPPRSPVLAFYGEELPAFVDGFSPASAVPYLSDVARLEMLRVRAFHAADAEPLAIDQIAALLADEEQLAKNCFHLHPSVGVLRSAYAITSLWAAHQTENIDAALGAVNPESAETALVLRVGLEVEVFPISSAAARFIEGLQHGMAFGAAAEQGFAVDAEFDLAGTLSLLIHSGALCAALTQGSATL